MTTTTGIPTATIITGISVTILLIIAVSQHINVGDRDLIPVATIKTDRGKGGRRILPSCRRARMALYARFRGMVMKTNPPDPDSLGLPILSTMLHSPASLPNGASLVRIGPVVQNSDVTTGGGGKRRQERLGSMSARPGLTAILILSAVVIIVVVSDGAGNILAKMVDAIDPHIAIPGRGIIKPTGVPAALGNPATAVASSW